MSNHAKEPWFIGRSRITSLNICYTDSDGNEAIVASPNFNFSNHHEIARRIAACVNALAGVPTEWIEKFGIDGSENVAQENARLTKQRDELLAERGSLSICWDDIQRLVKALSWLGYSTPESKEEQAASQKRLVLNLICAVEENKKFMTESRSHDGWQWVPVKPTEAMLDEFDSIVDFGSEDSKDAWSRMLAAAPKPEGGAA